VAAVVAAPDPVRLPASLSGSTTAPTSR
jgi:hypothetical protein